MITGIHAVIGAGFGDEGKGHVVDYLCSKAEGRTIVVRFSGGHQAMHHVVTEDDTSHVFAHFGSGTFRGIPTHWSHTCPVEPIALFNEYDILLEKGARPELIVHPKCPVTTPFERMDNRLNLKHGSCGVGIYSTRRREENHYHLLFEDLFYPTAFKFKMDAIEQYYSVGTDLDEFYEACGRLVNTESGIKIGGGISEFDTIIFEGSQGILLDQDHGFFPNVTPSTVVLPSSPDVETWLVTRAYQTRHGKGPMSKIVPNKILDNPYERNFPSLYQGDFRKTLLSIDLLKYSACKVGRVDNVVVNCLDLMGDEYRAFKGEEIIDYVNEERFLKRIELAVDAKKIYKSHSPKASGIEVSNES